MTPESLQITLDTLQPARTSPTTDLNRLCVTISDVHFTDGTVGIQNAEATTWRAFFANLEDVCQKNDVKDLTLVLAGDVVDMIRTAEWAKEGVYPWQRSHPKYPQILRRIVQGIINQHAKENASKASEAGEYGFFYHLHELKVHLKAVDVNVEVIVLLGNHDKEILTDDVALRMFYEHCLQQPVEQISDSYRRWIGRMYGDEKRFVDKGTVPWLPFYWGDADLRLFITHGQWRDSDNSCRIEAQGNLPGWTVKDGWSVDVWQKLNYSPFIAPCFGDTVAAGVLSSFIYQAKQKLKSIPNTDRVERILDELDLYRPTSAAVARVLQETRRTSTKAEVRDIIESELYQALITWLCWDFTLESSPPARRVALKIARAWLWITGPFRMFGIQLTLVRTILSVLAFIENLIPSSVYNPNGVKLKDIKTFPTFQQAFWQRNFRIHGEGHTHVPLQAEADVDYGSSNNVKLGNNFTYINFGTWRDQIVTKEKDHSWQKEGYRRRGVGRALYVWQLPNAKSTFKYYVADILSWSDHMDRL